MSIVLPLDKSKKYSMITSYDYYQAKISESSGIDMILVGDSLANVVLGLKSTKEITVDDICYHLRAVKRGAPNTFVIADLPFASSFDKKIAVADSIKLMQNSADAVKIEGGNHLQLKIIEKLQEINIPVMGHLGLLPQTANNFSVKGANEEEAKVILEQAKRIAKKGAFAIVLELIPYDLAEIITKSINIPTIGIGAGKFCDGQVLVYHDVLGITDKKLKMIKRFAEVGNISTEAIKNFIQEVQDEKFPTEEQSFKARESLDALKIY